MSLDFLKIESILIKLSDQSSTLLSQMLTVGHPILSRQTNTLLLTGLQIPETKIALSLRKICLQRIVEYNRNQVVFGNNLFEDDLIEHIFLKEEI